MTGEGRVDQPPFEWDWILPGIFMFGSMPHEPKHIDELHDEGIQVILSLTVHSIEEHAGILDARRRTCIANARWPIQPNDWVGAAPAAETLSTLISKNIPTYMHCRHGVSRSGMVTAAYFILFCDYPLSAALAMAHRHYSKFYDEHGDQVNDVQMKWLTSL